MGAVKYKDQNMWEIDSFLRNLMHVLNNALLISRDCIPGHFLTFCTSINTEFRDIIVLCCL